MATLALYQVSKVSRYQTGNFSYLVIGIACRWLPVGVL